MRSTRSPILAAALVLSACGGSGERAEDEILIAAIFDLTGPTADVGLDYAAAVQGHVEWLNEQGGIGGRPVRLIYQDYGYQVPAQSSCTPSSCRRAPSSSWAGVPATPRPCS